MCQKSNLLKGKGDRRRDGMKIEENCKKSCGLCGLEGGGGRRRKDSGGGRRRKDSGGERRRKDSGGEAGGGGGCKPGMIRRGGKNVVVKTGSNSRSQCEADCKANSECVAFDYTTNEQSDSCRGVKEVQGDKDPRWGKNDDGREVCIMGSGGGSGGTSKGKGSSGGGSSGNGSGGEGGGGGGCKPGLIRRGGKNVVVKTGSNSRSKCEADCKANSECVAFDYTTTEQSDSCRGVKEVEGDKDPRWGKNDDGREVCILGSGGGSGGTSK